MHGHTHYYQATMLEIVINCLRIFVVVIYCYHGDGSHLCTKYHCHMHLEIAICCCYHGDGSDGRHVYHGHTYYYQQLIGRYVGNSVL